MKREAYLHQGCDLKKLFAVLNLALKNLKLENLQGRGSDVAGGWLNSHKH